MTREQYIALIASVGTCAASAALVATSVLRSRSVGRPGLGKIGQPRKWAPGISSARLRRIISELTEQELMKLQFGLELLLKRQLPDDPKLFKAVLLQKPQWSIIGRELLTKPTMAFAEE